jgi:hypothetical protein
MTPARAKLLDARKLYSKCAARIEQQIKSAPQLSAQLSARIVGIGIACDWVRRAAEMEGISFIGDHLNESPWTPSFVETTRYGFAWYGINAIFARDDVLGIIGAPSPGNDGELQRFRILFAAAGLSPVVVVDREVRLRSILAESTTPRLPGIAAGTPTTTLYAIDKKYIPPATKSKGAAKKIAEAAASGNMADLDLPLLLYAFRNWSVHGNALHGSFGGRPKFATYVELLLETLAETHLGTAAALLNKLSGTP